MHENIPPLQSLLFRRQFLLGPSAFKPTNEWNCFSLNHGFILSSHPDLDVVVKSREDFILVMIGFAVDPKFPKITMSDLADSILSDSIQIRDVIDRTYSFAGRWLIIFQDKQGTYLFNDPCGFRQVFYYSNGNDVWCGSQPEIIRAVNSFSWITEQEPLEFLVSRNHARNESVWIGNQTIYQNCHHLIPNHYLDINRLEQVRFYPEQPLPELEAPAIIDTAVSIFQGIYEAITAKQKVQQALTSGLDSRILLAASKNFAHNIEYYVDRQGILPAYHRDIWVPKLLAKKLKINFTVRNSDLEPPGWFLSILSQNVTGARALPKIRPIYTSLINNNTLININGNGCETCRNWYDQYCFNSKNEIDDTRLPGIHGFVETPYIRSIVEEWRAGLHTLGGRDRNVLDMLYWEQRLGNWGALYSAEKDIAGEEFSPFNCRLLIDILFASPRYLRSAPKYELFRKLILAMWPEAMSLPINPLAKRPGIPLWKRKVLSRTPPSLLKMYRKVRTLGS